MKKARDCSDDSEKLFYIALIRQKNYQEKVEFKVMQHRDWIFFPKLLATEDREKGPPISENIWIFS